MPKLVRPSIMTYNTDDNEDTITFPVKPQRVFG